MRHYNIPIFIVHYGCPHMCVFCNQAKITGRETNIEPDDIRQTIDEYLETLNKKFHKRSGFFWRDLYCDISRITEEVFGGCKGIY